MFKKYVVEVLNVARKQNVDLDTACNKFVADVRAGEALDYNTNDDAKVNFSALKIVFDAMDGDAQEAAIAELKQAVHDKVYPVEDK